MSDKSDKPKNGPKGGRPKGSVKKKGAVNVNVWVRKSLGQGLDKLAESLRPSVTKTALVELALELLLEHYDQSPPTE